MQQPKGGNSVTTCCEHNGEVSKFLVDEGQQYTEEMVVYLMSRMRNPASKCKPHMKITCNPDKNSFLRKWVDWYLLEDGLPDPEKAGKLRYFVRLDNTMHWGDSREELLEKFGRRDAQGNLLPLEHPRQVKPLTFTFIPATVYDNPVLMEIQPEYVTWLEGLGRVEKERLLYGNWDATEEGSGYFKREWLSPLKESPDDVIKRVRAWDIAGSLPSETLPNPDWTVGVLMAKTRSGKYIIEDVVRFRARFGEVLDKIIATAHDDGKHVMVRLPQEPGQAGKSAVAAQITALAEEGFTARARPTNKSKVTRFQPFASVAEAGVVYYIENLEWNDTYFNELENFDGDRKKKDDQVDATADAFIELAQGLNIPLFTLPDMKQENIFTR